MSLQRDPALYNGVSQRLRGWKSKKSDKHAGVHISTNPTVMRWDGAARSSSSWDSLRRVSRLPGRSASGQAYHIPTYMYSQRA